MKKEVDVLQFTPKKIKKSIRDIMDSYSNYWDILAELLQNSVDAIIRKGNKKGNIGIVINCKQKSIVVKDDGIGISDNKVGDLISPFSTDKEDEVESIGEKGVGLSFVFFSSNYFKIKTCKYGSNLISIGTLQGARSWVKNDDDNNIKMQLNSSFGYFDGTEITIKDIENNEIFDLGIEKIIFLLRTKTAIGNTSSLYNNPTININVQLDYYDKSGKLEKRKVDYSYFSPIEKLSSNNIVDYNDVIKKFDDNPNMSDLDKRDFLKNKVTFYSYTVPKEDGQKISFWACYVSSHEKWDELSIKSKIIGKDEEKSDNTLCLKPGVTFSIKGMPTGISYPMPQVGNSGWIPNFFIIINDDSLRFDIGRKAIPEKYKADYNKLIKLVFNKFTTNIASYLKIKEENGWDKSSLKQEVDSLPKINSKVIKFRNSPFDQEASVAAIFYELIGTKKCFIDLTPCISGYRNKYDLYGYFKRKFVVIEFKYHLKNIVKDYKNYTKMANEMDYIVCWNVTEEDESEIFKKTQAAIVSLPLDDYDNEYMPEATHKIVYSGIATPVYVIDLKVILELLNKNENYFVKIKKEN